MPRVLVTGASGMLGGAVADLLARRGDDVSVMQRRSAGGRHRELLGDIRDRSAVQRAVRGQDAVVHLAAKVDVIGPEREFYEVNVRGTQLVVAEARDAGVGRLVHVSSPSVAHAGASLVGAPAGPPSPRGARSPYARTKAVAEQVALAADGRDLAVLAVRPHLVWGPGDAQLVGGIAERARQGRLVTVGSGAALVDATYVDNAAAALVAAVDRTTQAAGRALVVTNGEPRPVIELVTGICAALGVPPPRRHVPRPLALLAGSALERLPEVTRRVPGLPLVTQPPLTRFLVEQLSTAHWFDQRETRAALDWTPQVSIDEGLQRLAQHGAPGAQVR